MKRISRSMKVAALALSLALFSVGAQASLQGFSVERTAQSNISAGMFSYGSLVTSGIMKLTRIGGGRGGPRSGRGRGGPRSGGGRGGPRNGGGGPTGLPEPGTLMLTSLGMLLIGLFGWRRKK